MLSYNPFTTSHSALNQGDVGGLFAETGQQGQHHDADANDELARSSRSLGALNAG